VPIDPIKLPVLAERKLDENWRFREFLKSRCKLADDELDQVVFELTRRIWAGIDCTACANCCKTVRPTLDDADVEKLARRLKMRPEELVKTFLVPNDSDGENRWQTRSAPCPFLENNHCGVYDDRPADCRGYPYLYEPDFVYRTIAMIERTPTCPIVFEVMEALKESVGFHRRSKRR